MGKTGTIFVCSNCGNESQKWFGKCPACNEWNTCYEEKQVKQISKGKNKKTSTPTSLNNIKKDEIIRTGTGFEELDRVLGGGLVKGSLVLLRRRTRNRKIYINTSNMRQSTRRRKSIICIWRRIGRANKNKSR